MSIIQLDGVTTITIPITTSFTEGIYPPARGITTALSSLRFSIPQYEEYILLFLTYVPYPAFLVSADNRSPGITIFLSIQYPLIKV